MFSFHECIQIPLVFLPNSWRGIPGAADSRPAPMSQHVGAHAGCRHQTWHITTKFLHQRQDFLRTINWKPYLRWAVKGWGKKCSKMSIKCNLNITWRKIYFKAFFGAHPALLLSYFYNHLKWYCRVFWWLFGVCQQLFFCLCYPCYRLLKDNWIRTQIGTHQRNALPTLPTTFFSSAIRLPALAIYNSPRQPSHFQPLIIPPATHLV